MAELLKSCRNKTCRHTLLGPMERSRRGYSFTDLVPCLTDQFGRLRHLRPHQDFQYFFHLRLPHRHHHRSFYTHSLCPQCVPPRTQLLEDNPALPHRNGSAHAARFTALTIDHSRDEDVRSPGRSSKRSRTASASAPRRSRRPFTVFPSKRATRPSLSPSANCKHFCHAFLCHGRKCLSPCARRRPGHYHCRCVRHQRR